MEKCDQASKLFFTDWAGSGCMVELKTDLWNELLPAYEAPKSLNQPSSQSSSDYMNCGLTPVLSGWCLKCSSCTTGLRHFHSWVVLVKMCPFCFALSHGFYSLHEELGMCVGKQLFDVRRQLV